MDKFVLIVEMEVRPDSVERFTEIITRNAQASVRDEPGCSQFDVLHTPDNPTRFVLYEVYDDEDAFEAHRATPHFAAFNDHAADMLVNRGSQRLHRIVEGGA
ncbi:MAG: putative quinol monooxygenase [Alphaproteobacteria bacterium]